MQTIEWIPFNPPIPFGPEHQFVNNEYVLNKNSFSGQKLAQPGVVLLTSDGRQILIGDVNYQGGTCGCCPEVREDTVIAAYAILKYQVVSK